MALGLTSDHCGCFALFTLIGGLKGCEQSQSSEERECAVRLGSFSIPREPRRTHL